MSLSPNVLCSATAYFCSSVWAASAISDMTLSRPTTSTSASSASKATCTSAAMIAL